MGNKHNNLAYNGIRDLIQISFAGLLLFNPVPQTWATEAPEKIFVTADHMKMNIETGNSTYTGHVKISQGELVLTGDTVTLEQGGKELERLIVTGKPARYHHLTETGETIEAESEHMVYTVSKNTLVMTTNAHLKQPDHQLSSQKIIFDTEKKIVIAGGDNKTSNNGAQRVNITLTPKESVTNE